MSFFQTFLVPSSVSAACPAKTGPGARLPGGPPDRFGGPAELAFSIPVWRTRRNGPAARRTVRRTARFCWTYRRTGGLYKFVGRVSKAVFSHFPSSPRPPPSPWPSPPQASPPPSLSTQPIPSKLRSGVDQVVLKLSTEDLRVSSTALGDRDLSSSSCAPCLRVNPFCLLFPLTLASHSICSCYCVSRSRVYLGLDPFV
jgi:hypothetical protein